MAQVPREAVRFARMVCRAFYSHDFVVIMDAVLNGNNYCAHHHLARRLQMQPKELRQILVRMVHARLMKSDKRQQTRINLRDNRRPTTVVHTEFWYVPLSEIVDSFVYRVHIISKEVEAKRSTELSAETHKCRKCGQGYLLIDIVGDMIDGNFVCKKLTREANRRPGPCGGLIEEKDNSSKIKETDRILEKLKEELLPLRTKANECAQLDIPSHPLEGADEKTWGELVPETVGVYGEAVDEDGLDKDLSERFNKERKQEIEKKVIEKVVQAKKRRDDAPIPEKPSWFKDSNRDGEDAEDDWESQQNTSMLESKTGTAASFAEEDERLYYERYLSELAGTSKSNGKEANGHDEVVIVEPTSAKPIPSPQQDKIPSEDVDELDNVLVSVAGKQMKFSQVTDEMTDDMTAEEYKAYFALAKGAGNGGGDEEDDDEFD